MPRRLQLVALAGETRTVRIAPNALASGGDGAIHLIEGEPALVAKLYHEPGKDPTRLDKVRAMLADPPQLPPIDVNGFRYIQMAWPLGWLENMQGAFAGYVMPLVDLSRATALENLLAKKTRRLAGLPESYGYRLSAAANLSALVAELHSHRHHIIDLKPINLNVYTDTFYMALLDCDGLSVHGANGERFPAHQYSDGYICPEALQQPKPPQALGEEQDRFALAVILFQLLNQGLHPYQGVPAKGRAVPPTNGERIQKELYAYGRTPHPALAPSPWSIHDFFDDETRLLFDRAFTSRYDRPSAREWRQHLQPYTEKSSGKLLPCPANPEHVQFEKGCPWCELENRQQQANRNARIPNHRPNYQQTQWSAHSRHQGNRKQTTPPVHRNRIPRSSFRQWKATFALPKHWFRYLTGTVTVLLLLIFGGSYLDELYWRSRRLDNELLQLENPVIRWQSGAYRNSNDRWRESITIEPTTPSSGHWELVAVDLIYFNGSVVKGSISGFVFKADEPIDDGGEYTLSVTLRYTPTSGEAVTIKKQWPILWSTSVQIKSPIIVPHLVKKFKQEELDLGSKVPGLGYGIKFSQNGKFAVVGVNAREDPYIYRNRILVFAKGEDKRWVYADILKPQGPFVVRFAENIQISEDGGLIMALARRNRPKGLQDELHIFERTSQGRWQPKDVVTIPPTQSSHLVADDFALAANGKTLAVLGEDGIRIYRPDANLKWKLHQMLPKPQLGDGSLLEGDILLTSDGRQLFVGTPKSSRSKHKEGAVLMYSLGQDELFPEQPNYISPGKANHNFGRNIALSGNDKVLAVADDVSTLWEWQIRVYDVDYGRLIPMQVINKPKQIGTGRQDMNFSLGFSLSYDGKRLLSGPFPYKIAGGLSGPPYSSTAWREAGVKSMLYEREEGKYIPIYLLTLEDVNFKLFDYAHSYYSPDYKRPDEYFKMAISPDGSELLMGFKGEKFIGRNGRIHNVKSNSMALYSLPN